MFKDEYRKEMDQVNWTPEQKERLLAALAAPPAKKTRRAGRMALAAAALAALLSVAAVAASPSLRDALSAALGSFEPYSQAVEGVSAVDQGIEIRVVSALMDQVGGTAYLEVTDKTGDRLGEDMRLRSNVVRNLEPIAYDPESRTALFEVDLGMAINEILMGRAEEVELTCLSLHPGRVELPSEEVVERIDGVEYFWERGAAIPSSLYTTEPLDSRPLSETERAGLGPNRWGVPVLLPNQTPADLGSEYFSLSSLGFDETGVLHVQLALADGVYVSNAYNLDVDILPGLWPEELGLDYLTHRRTLLDGGRYVDISFEQIGPELAALLPDATVTGVVYTAPPIEGEWKLSFPYEPLAGEEIAIDQPFCVQDVTLAGVELTATRLYVTFHGDTGNHYFGGQPLHLFCRDGSILKLLGYDQIPLYQNEAGEKSDMYGLTYEQKAQGEDGWQIYGERDSWAYPRAVDPGEITAFSWGQWYVPLEGEAAGQGDWLDQVPEATPLPSRARR